MIHGTWRRDEDGYWAIWIPHDKFWGTRAPQVGDTVLTTRKDGVEKLEKLASVEEHGAEVRREGGWLCTPVTGTKFNRNDHDDSGLDHEYEYDLGIDPHEW